MKESYSMKLYPLYNLFQNTSTENEIKDYYSSYHSPSRSQRKESKQQYSINETSSLFSIPENGSIENYSSINDIINNSNTNIIKTRENMNKIYTSPQPSRIQKKFFQRNKNIQDSNKTIFNSFLNNSINNIQNNKSTMTPNKLNLYKSNYLYNIENKPIEEYVTQNEKVSTPKKKNKTIILKNFEQIKKNKLYSPDVNKYLSKFNNIINNYEEYNNKNNKNNNHNYINNSSDIDYNGDDNLNINGEMDDILNIALDENIHGTMTNLTNKYLNKNTNTNSKIITDNDTNNKLIDDFKSFDFNNNLNNIDYNDIKNKNNNDQYFSNIIQNNDFKINE